MNNVLINLSRNTCETRFISFPKINMRKLWLAVVNIIKRVLAYTTRTATATFKW